MKVKKFTAPSMPEAMKQIRAELGMDAVILNSKVVYKGGLLGFFRKKQIEVIAAVDRKGPIPRYQPEKKELTPKGPHARPFPKKETGDGSAERHRDDMLREIATIKEMVANIANEREMVPLAHVPAPFQKVFDRLDRHGINRLWLKELAEHVLETYYENKKEITEPEAASYVKQFFLEQLKSFPFGGITFHKKFVMCLGPTGVGKTTTLAKIAAYAKIQFKKKIAFITTDTYRIGAVEQLKTYAKILDVPVEVCYTLEDFQQAVKKFETHDVTFIDTAGRNFRNAQYVKDLGKIIDFDKEIETFLVFSLTAKEEDMVEIYEQFSTVPIDRFIFTKMDETASYGAMVNMPLRYKKGIAYITNGQDVPDDILEGTAKTIVDKIVGE